MDETVLADVGTGAGLGLYYAAGAALFIADDAKLWWFHTARQVHIKHRAQLLQQLKSTIALNLLQNTFILDGSMTQPSALNSNKTYLCVKSASCLEKQGEIGLHFTSIGVGPVLSLTL